MPNVLDQWPHLDESARRAYGTADRGPGQIRGTELGLLVSAEHAAAIVYCQYPERNLPCGCCGHTDPEGKQVRAVFDAMVENGPLIVTMLVLCADTDACTVRVREAKP